MNKAGLSATINNGKVVLPATLAKPRPGIDGVTYTPHIDDNGMLYWTNDGGRENPEPVKVLPERGVDYWTPEDIAEINAYIDQQLGLIENGAY